MKSYLFICFYFFSLFGCKYLKDNYATNKKVIAINLFCFSFQDKVKDDKIWNITLTNTRIPIKSLTKKEYILNTIIDSTSLNKISNCLKNNFSNKVPVKQDNFDSRFALTFSNSDKTVDTLLYVNDSTICFNNKFLYVYSFNYMDSIRNYLSLKCIKCN